MYNKAIMKNKLLLLGLILATFASAALAMGQPPRPPVLADLQNRISYELNLMNYDLATAARQLSSTGLSSSAVYGILQKLYNDHTSAVDIATIDLDGRLLRIEPERYKGSEGQIISDQPHFILLKKTGKPVLSEMFKTVEGFYAVSLAYPVFSPEGKLIGSVSMVFKPDALMGNIIKSAIAGLPAYEALAIQKDGRIIYDKDILQIGKMTFSDPLYQSYPSVIELAKRITTEASGTGTYDFPVTLANLSPVAKATEWTTISLHGTEWRLILSKIAE